LLLTFRRPCYRQIITTNTICDPEKEVFSKWSDEDGGCYNMINAALLNDDYQVLKNHVQFINSLRMAIKNNNENESFKPTFTSTSRNKDVAHHFGDYTFEIDASKSD
ncbi:unnamed protein product, partial [Rotaria sp. Silwood1]